MGVPAIDAPTPTPDARRLPANAAPHGGRCAPADGPAGGGGRAARRGRAYRGAARAPEPAPAAASATDPGPDCPVVRPGRAYAGRQGHAFVAGVSAESVGARGLCLHLVTIPPGGRGRAHLHAGHETAFYVLRGTAETRFGPGLRRRATVRAGEFHYIPAGVPHLPLNASADEPFVAVLARTDPNEQESVVLLPELEGVATAAV